MTIRSVPGNYYVYILTNNSRVLCVGITNDLRRRVAEHRAGIGGVFTRKYHVHQLVWCERFGTPNAAIAMEKRIKDWNRAKKVALISKINPKWDDLMPEDRERDESTVIP